MDDSPKPVSSPETARRPHSGIARVIAALTSAFGWLMCTLAAGAVAAFAAIVFGVRPCWITFALALPLTVVLKLCGCLIPRSAAGVAALAVLVAGLYAECLVAIARIAAVTGFPFGQAFHVGGTGLMLQVAELGMNAISVLAFTGAAAVAALLAAWLARPAAGS